jgi:hypothetical protein
LRSLTPLSLSPAATLSKIDIVGKGFGFWNTMPILRRMATGSTLAENMSSSSRKTCPLTHAPGVTSCILLRQRTRVDFPQPDGPIIAVTAFSLKEIETRSRTFFWPNPALRLSTCSFCLKFPLFSELLEDVSLSSCASTCGYIITGYQYVGDSARPVVEDELCESYRCIRGYMFTMAFP